MRTASLIPAGGGVVAAAVLVAALGACGSSGGPSSSGGVSTGAGTSAGAAATGTVVMVGESEFRISLNRTQFAPGTYTFVARDDGSVTHALAITGPELPTKASGDIGPGQSTRLTVTLRKGTYDIYCPVANHKQLGMNTRITVS